MTEAASTALVAVSDLQGAGTAVVPVSAVRTVLTEEQQRVISHTKAVGVVLPPPDIRAIIDKTAQFVARNGAEFEKRILANEKNNVKFNFLMPTDPYNAYYKLRLKDFGEQEGKEDGGAAKDQAPGAGLAAATGPAPAYQPIVATAPVSQQKKLEKPDDEQFTVHVPEGMFALDLDLMKLTAQFVARNGKAFLVGLSSRENTNPQFNFLKPTHSLYGFFTSLCDAYSRVMMPEKGLKEKLTKDATDRAAVLERCLRRLEWEQAKEREAQAAADEAERERQAMLAIDWHDFTVVETIEFDDEEDDDLPPPLTLKDIIQLAKAREYEAQLPSELPPELQAQLEELPEPADMEMDMDEEERALVEQAQQAGQPPIAEAEMEEQEEEEEEQPMRVVKDYVRPTARAGAKQSYDPTKFVVSPITGELIPIEDMAEHMRISLIDPKYKEQKEAMMAKLRESTKAHDDEITRNLVGLARTRPDIFGSTEEEVTQAVAANIKDKQTSGQGRAVAWDGATTGGDALQNQAKAIEQNRQELAQKAGTVPPIPTMQAAGPGAVRPAGAIMTPGGNLPSTILPPPPVRPPAVPPPPPLQAAMALGLVAPPGPPPVPTGMVPPGPPPMPAANLAPPGPPPLPVGAMRPPVPMPPSMGMMPPPPMPPPTGATLPPPPPLPAAAAPVQLPPPPVRPREASPEPDEPEAKRPRLDFVLEPEEEFLARHPGPSKVRVMVPDVDGNDKLIGQLMEVEVASLQDTVLEFKARLAAVLDVPANKQKLARDEVGFLRDELSLAHYNITPDVTLQLGLKERGGRKK